VIESIQATQSMKSDHGLVAVSYPGIDVPGLCESEWDMVPDPSGHYAGFMVNRLSLWVDAEAWRLWSEGVGGETCVPGG